MSLESLTVGGGGSCGWSTVSVANDVESCRQSDTDVTMTLLAWLVFHTLSAMTTLR